MPLGFQKVALHLLIADNSPLRNAICTFKLSEWRKDGCIQHFPYLHFTPPLRLVSVFFPTLHRPLPPLFPDALSALVCVWAATVRGHCLPCLTRGAQCVCVCVCERKRQITVIG